MVQPLFFLTSSLGFDAPVLAHNVLFLIIVFAHGATGTAHLHQQFQSSPEKSLSRSSDIWTPQLFVVLLKSASLGEPLPTMICRSAEYVSSISDRNTIGVDGSPILEGR